MKQYLSGNSLAVHSVVIFLCLALVLPGCASKKDTSSPTNFSGQYQFIGLKENECETWISFLPVDELEPKSIVNITMEESRDLQLTYQTSRGEESRAFDLTGPRFRWQGKTLVRHDPSNPSGAPIPLGMATQNHVSHMQQTEEGIMVSGEFTETGLFLLFIPFQDEYRCSVLLSSSS